ncbi:MAG TPA: LysM peptidoglycan-binding domain-containing M23 family metallopeptidase, partial [Dehalococcoidia bacterium]|nr:LysM peptidoglycan-binding domain-containing M23 family metallopeptidase [Dehalococcoidia bacterium]
PGLAGVISQAAATETPSDPAKAEQKGLPLTPNAGETPPDAATPTPNASNCDTSQSALYCVYTIQPGDVLSTIASKFGVKPSDGSDLTASEMMALSNKPDVVSENDLLQPGQKLRVPRGNAVIHEVTSDTTLSDLASLYGVSVDSIISANALSNPDLIAIGSEILVPGPMTYAPPAAAEAPTPTATADDSSAAADDSSSSDDNSSSSADDSSSSSDDSSSSGSSSAPAASSSPKSSAGFIWPVTGPITSYFGPSHPLGIDIGLGPNGVGIPIHAAMAGTVSFAGGNACCSYGYYVVVDHGGGFQTLYGHLSKIDVSVGESVSQGETVGLSGTTGYSTGPHLHFEVHLNGKVVNPLSYLP